MSAPCIIFCALTLTLSFIPIQEVRRIQITGKAQGTTYSIIYYASDSLVNKLQIDSLLNRIDESLSIYKPNSLINRFNNSTTGCASDIHLNAVVTKSLEIYNNTSGLFDITVMPLTEAWGFGVKRDTVIPDRKTIQTILPCIGSNHLKLEGNRLNKNLACTKIDVNGIAQGYSVDLLAQLLERCGILNYIIELGGEIRVKGRKSGDQKMKIGIESPATADIEAGIFKRILVIDSGAITTSGNYRRFYESGGKHITHLFDPHTGYSINNELIAATVYAPDAITADGYDNALMNMGLVKALAFIANQNDVGRNMSAQNDSNKNKPDKNKPDKNNADQGSSNQNKSNQNKSNQNKSNQNKSNQNKSDPNKIEAYLIYKDKDGNVRDTASAGFYKLIQQ